MFDVFSRKQETTVGDIKRQLREAYDLRDPYEIRLLNKNGNPFHQNGTKLKMPRIRNVAVLGIKTVADLRRKIESKFKIAGHSVAVEIWDSHKASPVGGGVHYETIRK